MCPRIPIRPHMGTAHACAVPIAPPPSAPNKEGVTPGTLYVVPTPIGNWEDISLRALRILMQVDLILAEDARHTRQLLSQHRISTRLLAYSARPVQLNDFQTHLCCGKSIALVCDAGTPAIADPGAALITAALDAGLRVTALPGPMAAIVALIASGFPANRFVFDGFPPRKREDRLTFFAAMARESRTIILYESTAYLRSTLRSLQECLGPDRLIVIACDLTTDRENLWRGNLAAANRFARQRVPHGVYTVVVAAY